jgi:hypothetical protein
MVNHSNSCQDDLEKKLFAAKFSVKCASAAGLFLKMNNAGRIRRKRSAAQNNPADQNIDITAGNPEILFQQEEMNSRSC